MRRALAYGQWKKTSHALKPRGVAVNHVFNGFRRSMRSIQGARRKTPKAGAIRRRALTTEGVNRSDG
jgi:hypothetical protein